MTYDELAIRFLLQGKKVPAWLVAEAAQAAGEQCPDCGGKDVEDNGSTEYRCVACDHRWGFDEGERYGF